VKRLFLLILHSGNFRLTTRILLKQTAFVITEKPELKRQQIFVELKATHPLKRVKFTTLWIAMPKSLHHLCGNCALNT
jgi:hypothetical protein